MKSANNAYIIELYKSLFRGRKDVYAVRWEKAGRSGYMPAYKIDWTDFNRHKSHGGTFKDYKKKISCPMMTAQLKVIWQEGKLVVFTRF